MRFPLLAALATLTLLLAAEGASAKTVWLCKPGARNNPCERSLTATRVDPAGARVGTERIRIARRAPIDCFYVYPTVSEQKTANANRRIDPQQRSIAYYQASRFSQACRVYAPVYRQLTLAGIAGGGEGAPADSNKAYTDVRAAWRDYLKNHNKGRGVVFIGHSQGAFMLRRLLAQEVDTKPALRKRMVSALLLGGNVTVARGKDTGGDFQKIRACRSSQQLHCVVAYSTFNEPPPADARFGRVPPADTDKLEVLCNNPAALKRGARARLSGYVPREPFPGTLGLGVAIQIGELPKVSTPWLKLDGHYAGRCVSENGASSLRIDALGGARELTPVPDATWGLHLSDVNIALGDLTTLVLRQSAAAAGD